MKNVFQLIIDSEQQLRELCGYPNAVVQNKSITVIDHHCRDFIARSPLIFVATSDSSGNCDVSPRGDAEGFVLVVDDKHLVIPERPGNRRFDTLRNLISNPSVGLIFIIPGLEETLRINGRACIVKDPLLLNQMEAHGKTPILGIGVEVEECYIHCAKAFKSTGLRRKPCPNRLPSLPNMQNILAFP
jgi:PPOX class probable FMN-dependent enzyme